jgi:hypothetical protein
VPVVAELLTPYNTNQPLNEHLPITQRNFMRGAWPWQQARDDHQTGTILSHPCPSSGLSAYEIGKTSEHRCLSGHVVSSSVFFSETLDLNVLLLLLLLLLLFSAKFTLPQQSDVRL